MGLQWNGVRAQTAEASADASSDDLAGKTPYEIAISKGDRALAAHDTKGAREHYTLAAKIEPSYAEAYSKRAVVWLGIAKHQKAIDDFSLVLGLKPGDAKTLMKRAAAYAALGLFEPALSDLNSVLAIDRANSKAVQQKRLWGKLQQEHAECTAAVAAFLAGAKSRGEGGEIPPQERQAAEATMAQLSRLLEVATHSKLLLMARANVRWQLGDLGGVLEDTSAAINVDGHLVEAYCLRGDALFRNGEFLTVQKYYKEGLKLDPDHKGCRTSLKAVKRFAALKGEFDAAFDAGNCAAVVEKVADFAAEGVQGVKAYWAGIKERECVCLGRQKQAARGVEACTEALGLNDQSVASLLARAELRLVQQEWGMAQGDFSKVLQLDNRHQGASEGLNRAKKLEKQAKAKDYYKILGVARDASAKEIRKAYRDLVLVWHPDKVPAEQKDEATVKFRDIKDAYEVLMDDDKRAIFDRGDDPLDNSQQQQQAHGFHGFPGFNGFPGFQGFNFQFRR